MLMVAFWSCTVSSHANRPAQYTASDTVMTLRGQGLLRIGYVFKVYEAGLYVGGGIPTEAVLDDVPKRLEIHYLRDIAAADLVAAGNETLQQQVAPGQLVALRERLDRINRWYVDVKAGDRYALTYIPGRGSELALNGRPLGVIEGHDFASAYFGIWLDPRTRYRDFRDTLMGQPSF